MKRLMLISALCGGFACAGYSQSIQVWIDQLAALQTFQQTIQEGYVIADRGLSGIGDTRQGEYELHSSYYAQLDTVNPALEQNPQLQELRELLSRLVQQIQSDLVYWRKQQSLSLSNH